MSRIEDFLPMPEDDDLSRKEKQEIERAMRERADQIVNAHAAVAQIECKTMRLIRGHVVESETRELELRFNFSPLLTEIHVSGIETVDTTQFIACQIDRLKHGMDHLRKMLLDGSAAEG